MNKYEITVVNYVIDTALQEGYYEFGYEEILQDDV